MTDLVARLRELEAKATTLRDRLGEAARVFHWRRYHMDGPAPMWADLSEHDREYWRKDGDTHAEIARSCGLKIEVDDDAS